MPATTTRLALPYPVATDPADVPADMQALAAKLDPAAAVFAQGTAAARPAAGVQGRFYFATDSAILYWDTGSAWATVGGGPAPGAPPLVTSLPGSPSDGQEVYYLADAANGIVWHLRYRSASGSAYKWEMLGGSRLFNGVVTAEAIGVGSAWADLATPGPQITLPLAGDYDLWLGTSVQIVQSSVVASMGIGYGASWTTPLAGGQIATTVASGTTVGASGSLRATGAAAGALLKARYYTISGSHQFSQRFVAALPVRVG